MDPLELQNLKDFLTLFNKLSERCFHKCVYDLGRLSLATDEIECVDRCIVKNVNVNHKLMSLYMEINPDFQEKKMKEQQEEMAKNQELAAAAANSAAASAQN
jgi:import inner membrane translocase subunit TIM10B